MAHVEHLVHFSPVCAAFLRNGLEERGNGEHVVFDDLAVLAHEVQHLGLRSAGAVHHTMDFGAQLVEQSLHHGSISARRRKHQTAGIDRRTFDSIGQAVAAAIHKLFGHCLVVALGIFLRKILIENIMAGRGQAITTHSTVVAGFVGSLSGRRKSHDDIARTDVGIINHIATFHAAGYGAVHNDGAHQIAHIGRFATGGINTHTHIAHLLQQLVGTVDDSRNHFAGNEHFVTPDGARHKDVVNCSHTQQVIGVHDESILRNAFPDGEVARFFPVHVSQARLGAGTIGVHDVAVFGVASENIGNDFAKSLWEYAFVYVLDSVVHILFHSAHTAHHVSLLRVHSDVCFI